MIAVGASATARADGPSVACVARMASGRAVVNVSLRDFFDKELTRLVKLQLKAEIHVEATLVRPRRLWFDERVATQARDMTVTWSKETKRFLLDGRAAQDDVARIDLERFSVWPPSAPEGPVQIEVEARLQVVTLSSLGKVATWIADRNENASASRSTLARSLISTLTNDLVRSAQTRCPAR